MLTYRGYFFDRGRIVGRHDFEADDDASALWLGSQICAASADVCDQYEVWIGTRHVGSQSTSPDTAEQIREATQNRLIETEETLVRSEWALARSRLLLARLKALSDPRRDVKHRP